MNVDRTARRAQLRAREHGTSDAVPGRCGRDAPGLSAQADLHGDPLRFPTLRLRRSRTNFSSLLVCFASFLDLECTRVVHYSGLYVCTTEYIIVLLAKHLEPFSLVDPVGLRCQRSVALGASLGGSSEPNIHSLRSSCAAISSPAYRRVAGRSRVAAVVWLFDANASPTTKENGGLDSQLTIQINHHSDQSLSTGLWAFASKHSYLGGKVLHTQL